MPKRKHSVRKQYKPYIDRLNSHPYVIPVVTFVVLFFLSIATLIGLNATTAPPSDSRIIEFSLEGTRESIPTRAKTVGEFLERIDVKLEQNDVVEPALNARIRGEKFHVNVYRARPVTIVEQRTGKRTFAYSAARTPRSVANQAGVRVYPEDVVDSEVPENILREGVLGEKIIIDRATPISLNLYGSPIEIRTHTTTVKDLLEEKKIAMGKEDEVRPKLSTVIKPGMQIFVLRAGTDIRTEQHEIPMPIEVVEDASLSFGAEVIRQQGSPGKRVITYEVKLENGKVVSRRKIQEVVTVDPVKQVVARGPQGSFGQALALLRDCEAGGNYAINTGNGYYGAYQFNVSTWNGYGGFTYPSDAPGPVQDQKATETYRARGWQPWPGCTSSLGLQDIYR